MVVDQAVIDLLRSTFGSCLIACLQPAVSDSQEIRDRCMKGLEAVVQREQNDDNKYHRGELVLI